jgi:hypothetical protein
MREDGCGRSDQSRSKRLARSPIEGRVESETTVSAYAALVSREPLERSCVASDRFDRFSLLAGALAGLLLVGGLALTWGDPSSEAAADEHFTYWRDDRGQHQISGLLLAPLVAFLLVFFGAGLQRVLRSSIGDSSHGAVAFGGAVLAAATFALVGMLEGAATNAAHEGERQATYTLSQLHSYDWVAWNAAFAAMLLATGLGARRGRALPTPLVWATIVIGASLITPLGFFGFFLLPLWLIVIGLWLTLRGAGSPGSMGG